MAVNQIMINHIRNHIKSMKIADMAIRLSVVMMMSIVHQFKYIEEKMLFISLWKKYWKKSNGAKNKT